MRTATPSRVLPTLTLALVAAACGGGGDAPDAAGAIDAPGAIDARVDATPVDADVRLACLGDPPPAGSGPVTIEGRVFAVDDYMAEPTAGAAIELRRTSDDSVVGTAVSADDGAFTIDAPDPVAGYFVVTAAGRLPTYAYADVPLPTGQDALLLVVTAAELAAWYADAGTTYTPGDRTVVAAIRDCESDGANEATVAAAPAPAALAYYDTAALRWDPALTAGTNGFALLADAAASVTLTPQFSSMTYPAEVIAARPDALTLAVITPYD